MIQSYSLELPSVIIEQKGHPPFDKLLLCVSTSSNRWWPVVLGDTRPEYPYHHNREQREKCFEKSPVDFATCAVADVLADHVFEDLSNCEDDHSGY